MHIQPPCIRELGGFSAVVQDTGRAECPSKMGFPVRESIPRQVVKKSKVLEEKKGVWGSQGEKDKLFFLHCFVLVNITMYPV